MGAMGWIWAGIAVCACSKAEDKDRPAKDPWATTNSPATNSPTTAADPWAAGSSAAPPPPTDPTPAAPVGQSSIAGLYRCEVFTYVVGGPATYIPSRMDKIVIDADGTYHYNNASGQTHEAPTTVSFEGGPLDGYVTAIRPSAAGRYLIINSRDPKTPVQAVHLGDSACYLRKN